MSDIVAGITLLSALALSSLIWYVFWWLTARAIRDGWESWEQ